MFEIPQLDIQRAHSTFLKWKFQLDKLNIRVLRPRSVSTKIDLYWIGFDLPVQQKIAKQQKGT